MTAAGLKPQPARAPACLCPALQMLRQRGLILAQKSLHSRNECPGPRMGQNAQKLSKNARRCSHCRMLEPTWRAIAEELAQDPTIKVAKVLPFKLFWPPIVKFWPTIVKFGRSLSFIRYRVTWPTSCIVARPNSFVVTLSVVTLL